jgi:hypothetical protein
MARVSGVLENARPQGTADEHDLVLRRIATLGFDEAIFQRRGAFVAIRSRTVGRPCSVVSVARFRATQL